MKVYIYSGVPGSGKTSFIAASHGGALVCSSDDFFMVDGEYRFDPLKLGEAHGACLRKFIDAVSGRNTRDYAEPTRDVVVDNTNTSVAEIAPYVALAQAYGHDVTVLTMWCDPEVAAARNVHGVPADVVLRMNDALLARELPPWWNHSDVPQVGFSRALGLSVKTGYGVTPNDHVVANRALDGAE